MPAHNQPAERERRIHARITELLAPIAASHPWFRGIYNQVLAAFVECPSPPSPSEAAGVAGEDYKTATKLGPSGESRCPDCGNSFQNESPADRPDLLRCASCKACFYPKPAQSSPAGSELPTGPGVWWQEGLLYYVRPWHSSQPDNLWARLINLDEEKFNAERTVGSLQLGNWQQASPRSREAELEELAAKRFDRADRAIDVAKNFATECRRATAGLQAATEQIANANARIAELEARAEAAEQQAVSLKEQLERQREFICSERDNANRREAELRQQAAEAQQRESVPDPVATAAICSAKIMRHDFDKMLAALTEIHNMVGRAGEHGNDLPSLIGCAISGVASACMDKSEAEQQAAAAVARVGELEQKVRDLRIALVGAIVDYDRIPYEMGTAEIERLERNRVGVTIKGEPRGSWYLMDLQAVDDIAKGDGAHWYETAVRYIDESQKAEAAARAEVIVGDGTQLAAGGWAQYAPDGKLIQVMWSTSDCGFSQRGYRYLRIRDSLTAKDGSVGDELDKLVDKVRRT